jgi:hypothetical protein
MRHPKRPVYQNTFRLFTAGDVVADAHGTLYLSVLEDFNATPRRCHLVRVDPQTGAMTVLPEMPSAHVTGLAFIDGELWGFSNEKEALLLI